MSKYETALKSLAPPTRQICCHCTLPLSKTGSWRLDLDTRQEPGRALTAPRSWAASSSLLKGKTQLLKEAHEHIQLLHHARGATFGMLSTYQKFTILKERWNRGKKNNMEAAKMHLGGRHCAAQQDTQRKTCRKMNTKQ